MRGLPRNGVVQEETHRSCKLKLGQYAKSGQSPDVEALRLDSSGGQIAEVGLLDRVGSRGDLAQVERHWNAACGGDPPRILGQLGEPPRQERCEQRPLYEMTVRALPHATGAVFLFPRHRINDHG